MTEFPLVKIPNSALPSVNDYTQLTEAVQSWLTKSPSIETRSAYSRELNQFLTFAGIGIDDLPQIRPAQISAWRDQLTFQGVSNTAIHRKLSVIRSLFGYLRAYGYAGANPADTKYVATPPVPRDGKTVGISPEDCRRLLESPSNESPPGIRDRAMLAILAYTGCRVGELCRLRIEDYKSSNGHRILEIRGKGGRERRVALHPEAFERLDAWLAIGELATRSGPLFRPQVAARGDGIQGFLNTPMTRRAVQKLIERYVSRLKLDPNVTVHSFRVTALTTARERGADLVDLQDFAGHADPRTTLAYIRNRDRLHRSPAYVLKY